MGGRRGGDPRAHKRGHTTTWRLGVDVLAAIGREVRPRRGRKTPTKWQRPGVADA